MKDFAVVGAGFSGAVMARQLADAGHNISVFESRSHVAGNCFTERHETGVMKHVYGPHIFHTQHQDVWDYINRFGEMVPYVHKVKVTVQGQVFTLPINLNTINKFFGLDLSEVEAEKFLNSKIDSSISNPVTFVDQALRFVGPELYEAFFAGYTRKQWGVDPHDLPASILARLPVRYNDDESYFSHPFQAIPKHGYTPIVESILRHERISVFLDTDFDPVEVAKFDHTFWTGPLDAFFKYEFGNLGYRTLDFDEETHDGDFQGCPVMNFPDEEIPITRITEHKHFAYWENHKQTVIYRESSRLCEEGDIPYYPIRLVNEMEVLDNYLKAASKQTRVSFLGRLGTYRYLDMDVTIKEALDAASKAIKLIQKEDGIIPMFPN
jgi:UDP-galactopyranose mutase